jgi:hypothetical protein
MIHRRRTDREVGLISSERFARRSANITDLENAKASEGEVGGFENGL